MKDNIVYIDSVFKDLVPRFLELKQKDINEMKNLLEKDNFEKISQLAHKIKGSCGGYGFKKISDYSREIETYCQVEDKEVIGELIFEIEKMLVESHVVYLDF